MSAPSATHASLSDYDRSIAALVTAFISDPFIRWMFPDAKQYLHYFPQVLKYLWDAPSSTGRHIVPKTIKPPRSGYLPASARMKTRSVPSCKKAWLLSCKGRCSPCSSR